MPISLLDPADEAAFRDLGYVVVDLVGDDELAELRATCERHHPERRTTWASDFYDPDPAVKQDVARSMTEALVPALGSVLTGHSPIMTNYVVNWPGPDGGLELHHHTSLIDERKARSVVVWCALNDADEDNGTLHVVPRSHHVPRAPWGERSPDWFAPHRDRLLRDHLMSVSVRPGQAIILDNALLHCSFPNVTNDPRRTAVAVVTPDDQPLRYYQWAGRGRLRTYRLDPEFFLESTSSDFQMADPDTLELEGEEDVDPTEPTWEELEQLLVPGSCQHEHLPRDG